MMAINTAIIPLCIVCSILRNKKSFVVLKIVIIKLILSQSSMSKDRNLLEVMQKIRVEIGDDWGKFIENGEYKSIIISYHYSAPELTWKWWEKMANLLKNFCTPDKPYSDKVSDIFTGRA